MARGRASGKGGPEAAEGGSTAKVTIGVAVVFAGVAVVLLIAAMVSDHWINTYVPAVIPTGLSATNPAYKTHYQGLFCTCYTGGTLSDIQGEGRNKEKCWKNTSPRDQCVAEDAYDKFVTGSPKPDSDYIYRATFLRATLGLLCAALFLGLLGVIVSLVAACKLTIGSLAVSITLLLLAAICDGVGNGIFYHGVYLTQLDKLTTYLEFPAFLKDTALKTSLLAIMEIQMSWSYIISWMSIGLFLIATFLLLTAICCLGSSKPDRRNIMYDDRHNPPMVPGQDVVRAPTAQERFDNPAYPYYLEGRPPIYSPQQPVAQKSIPRVNNHMIHREPQVSMIPARVSNNRVADSRYPDGKDYSRYPDGKEFSESLGFMQFE